MSKDISLPGYQEVFQKASQVIIATQECFLRQSNQTGITLYWEIGKLLAEITEQYHWGEQLYERLLHDLSMMFKNAEDIPLKI